MANDRPRALVTAPVRGPGLDKLHELADLVIDPWIDHHPLRIYNAEQLAERVAAEAATIVVVESDTCGVALFEQPLIAVASCRGDPNNVDVEAATAAGVPVLRAPGRNADAVAELAVGLILASTRGLLEADRDVRTGEIYKDGTIPYQRFRAWQIAGRTAGLVGLGAVGRALRWRLEGLGMEVVAYDPYADDATCSLAELLAASDVISMHAPVTPETAGMIGAARVRQHEGRGGVREHRPGPVARHRCPGRGTGLGEGGRGRPRSLRERVTPDRSSVDRVPPRGARPPHRGRHLRHRGQPHPDGGRRSRAAVAGGRPRCTSSTPRY